MSTSKLASQKEKTFLIDMDFINEFSSEHTRRSYLTDINHFFDYLEDRFPEINNYKSIEKKHIVQFRNFLQEVGGIGGEPCAPKTISRKLAALSSYFNFLAEKNIIETNITSSVKRPKREVITPTNALTRNQVIELLNTIDCNSPSGKLHKAMLVMFFTTGLRKSEILHLKRKDFTTLNTHKIVKYRGKGGKRGQKILHPQCISALEEYLDSMKEQGREHISEDWLFQPTRNPSNPTNLNRPLNPKTVNEIIQKYAKKISLTFHITPHSARATFIGELLNNGVDIYRVANEVNHSSVKTTEEYDKRRKNITDSPVYKLNFEN